MKAAPLGVLFQNWPGADWPHNPSNPRADAHYGEECLYSRRAEK